jgi:hypothetical protein
VKKPQAILQSIIDEETDIGPDNKVLSSGDDAVLSSTDYSQSHIVKESTNGSSTENSGRSLFKTMSLFTPERVNLHSKTSSNSQALPEELMLKKTRSFSMNEADECKESNNTILPTLELLNHSICDRSQINSIFSSHSQSDLMVDINELQADGLKTQDKFIVDDESQDSDCDCKIQNPRLKRALSLPYLKPVPHSFKHFDDIIKRRENGEEGKNKKFSVNSKKINKKYHKDDDKVNAKRLVSKKKDDNDRIFFHYLESLLDQLILKFVREKSKPMNQHRNRFKSKDCSG